MEPAERRATVERILADPPAVHPMEASPEPRMGVWATEPSCYRFIAERCAPGTRTIETGSGLSTVLFAALGARHICCTAGQEEADRVLAHCGSRGIATDGLRFEVGSSHATLPALEAGGTEVDLVLVDGSHAFPLPQVDWFYAAAMLRCGGTLIVDDIGLPAVSVLVRFLELDPRWRRVSGTDKWRAWERQVGGTLSEDWTEQGFYRSRRDALLQPARRVVGKIRHELGRRRT
ncbi:MAG: class I SAM-dependent methyltransferase [Acidimicrobiales bacterium]|nr:class I SAM-dependent methyltransferase [Acidimicrobiales bacterium]